MGCWAVGLLGCWAVGLLKIKKFLVDPPALTGQAVGPRGGLCQQKAESRNDLANRTIDRSDWHNDPCLAARAWCVVDRVPDQTADRPLARLAIRLQLPRLPITL